MDRKTLKVLFALGICLLLSRCSVRGASVAKWQVTGRRHIVLELAKTNSNTMVQWHFRKRFDKEPPSRKNIYHWYNQFEETGSVCKRSTGRPCVSDVDVDRIREAFKSSPQKSTYQASHQLQLPQKTVWHVLCKRLVIKPNKFQMVQALTPNDKIICHQFCVEMRADICNWPPRSPDITPWFFFCGGMWRKLYTCHLCHTICQSYDSVLLLPLKP
jgi:hypothetical protein